MYFFFLISFPFRTQNNVCCKSENSELRYLVFMKSDENVSSFKFCKNYEAAPTFFINKKFACTFNVVKKKHQSLPEPAVQPLSVAYGF